MMCEGGSPASCRMYSPRSVSMGVIPFAARASFTPASSESIDFDLIAFLTPCRRQISTSSSHASARVSAKSTVAPRRTASASKRSSHASRLASDRSRIAAPSPRSASKSSGPNSATALARSAVNPVDWNLRRLACNVASASASPALALKCIDWTCKALTLGSSGEHFGDVQNPRLRVSAATQPPLDVQHAAQVSEHDRLRAARLDVRAFLLRHRGGDLSVLDGKGASEAATGLA